ncbi:DUF6161 domain-containing protein [Pseudomonas chlororaphis]|uniref:DUF6161 domain-containing protein n=1 Tax=Pseudomonas chlororaphis TaxID=587753 RepID=A0AAX3FPQ6_9PSED|nr:DUF6161 domain-containing protein [Pseudomonas chlororaphis]AZC37668.1 hypothetical protein C4K37_3281 [Pseudomonas chlororaphis subsp. piscium]AZC44216.1 hypothetical protein C4K36_3291 [Pseudomonas chlororaphis subsp. piscium]WDG69863.1 DUF6161 domain-containing protein [Pseudomonas chlororaphis]WDH26310.1 DUF6161 domain-containing protein [Pseudomonas chlororaphis]WDH68389.1 DUF6161 domain-containing protein [Pseudomonas chlororaphis]
MTTDQENNFSDHSQSPTYDLISKSKQEVIQKLSNDNLTKWAELESKYWKEIDDTLQRQKNNNNPSKTHSSIVQEVSRYTHKIGELINSLTSNTLYTSDSELHNNSIPLLSSIFSFDLPQHDDPLADEFKNACHVGEATSAIYTYRMLSKHPEKHYHRGYEEGIKKNLKSVTEGIDNKTAQTLSGLNKKEGELNTSIKNAEEAIKKIVAAATSAIALSEPVKFWEDRKGIHSSNAQKYGKYASISAATFAIILALIVIYEYLSGTTHSWLGYEFTLPKSLSGIATILLISTAGIWSTRIFVKLMMANLTLETESIERATMIKTFVAMKAAEASIAQEAELLFYTTLFRPSNNVISEESTAPEFGKILDAILKAKPDKPSGPV